MRDHYIEQFRTFADEQRRSCTKGTPELKLGGFETSHQGFYCVDFAKNDGQFEIVAFVPEKVLAFSSIPIRLGAAALTIEHLRWDDVLIYHDLPAVPLKDIDSWFQRWFDPADERHDPTAELSGTIHSLGVQSGRLDVDFGTAPPEAFLDLLQLLERSGARTIRIGSSRAEADG